MEKMDLNSYLRDLEEIVNMDSGSADLDGCLQVAEFFIERFQREGFTVRVSREPGRHPHLEARYFARPGTDIDVLFIGHMDTVFPKGTALARPFRLEGDHARGPGVADMKSGDLLALYLASAIKAQKLPLNLCVALNSDEEAGSGDSAEWLRELGAVSAFCFNFEPGRDTGAFVKARKGVYEYRVQFKGIAAHAGVAPEKGASAVVEMARWIDGLTKLSDAKVGTTLNPGVVRGGTVSNVVAEDAEILIDLRYTDERERERVERAFDEMAANPKVTGVKCVWRRGEGFPPMNPNERTEVLIRLLEENAEALGQEKPQFVATGGGSDSNNLGGLSVSVVDACGPIGGNYHSDAEYMVTTSVEGRFALILETVKAIAARQRNRA